MKTYFMPLIRLALVLVCVFAYSSGRCEQVDAQIREIVKTLATTPTETVFWMYVDIDGDGIRDLLVTSGGNKEEEDSLNYAWQVFRGNKDGTFTRVKSATGESLLSLWIGRCWVGMIPELKRYGLLHLVCGTGGHAKCQLKAVFLEGGVFTEVPIGEPVNAEENFDLLWGRFKGPGAPVTHKALASEIR